MSSSPDGGIPSAGPSLDTAFGLLADETRRLSLYVLREHGGMSLADLADVVTGWSAVRRGDGRATADDRRERLVSLHHTHVPKLRAAGSSPTTTRRASSPSRPPRRRSTGCSTPRWPSRPRRGKRPYRSRSSEMTLGDIIDAAAANPTRLRVCSPDDSPDLSDRFGSRNVVVEHTTLPGADEGFVVVRRDGEFVGSVPVRAFDTLVHPPAGVPGSRDGEADEQFRALLGLLDDTVFTSLERDRMLATSREIEDRAWRLGHGRLYAGFQSLPVMHAEADVYRRLATKPDLRVEVFATPNGDPPAVEGRPSASPTTRR
ncbi:DUF7344 domain-containing protein [Halosegnis marinus]|uniref:DUF7344 domain-containing protein n=1 Tax=Halosegnis marinus TaxID=3034023 RepID=UPI00361F5975